VASSFIFFENKKKLKTIFWEPTEANTMNHSHFEDYSFTDTDDKLYVNLYDYFKSDSDTHNHYFTTLVSENLENLFYIFVRANTDLDQGITFKRLSFSNHIGISDRFTYGTDGYIDRITGFKELMQSFYLQHDDVFDKMVEDYAIIHESVHPEMQKVYDAIIDGVYEHTTPVIK
jgi:hypothetical protein